MTDEQLLRGVDVSAYQRPADLDWERMRASVQFAIVRASHGDYRDGHALEHLRGARRAVLRHGVGAYHCFSPGARPALQLAAFRAVADEARIGRGDIVPAVDVERVPIIGSKPLRYVEPEPAWCERLRVVVEELRERYDECLVYTNLTTWIGLGRPGWLLERPLWVASWGRQSPIVPGDAWWRVWQTGLGSVSGARHPIDINVARDPLPRIGAFSLLGDAERRRVMAVVGLTMLERERGGPE